MDKIFLVRPGVFFFFFFFFFVSAALSLSEKNLSLSLPGTNFYFQFSTFCLGGIITEHIQKHRFPRPSIALVG